jgi:hypothetical protein
MRVYIATARSPPRSEPAKSHALQPRATPRSAHSVALLLTQTRPSSSLISANLAVTGRLLIDSHQCVPYGKDHRSGWEGIGLANLRRAGYIDLVEFYEVPSYQGLSRLIEERATIDFAFVDGAHTFDYVLVDVFLIDKLLRPGGIIILDDLLYPSIRSVCRYVLLSLRYKCAGPKTPDMLAWRRLRSVGAKICRGGAFELARDMRLNFPLLPNYIALQKLEDDLIGDGH